MTITNRIDNGLAYVVSYFPVLGIIHYDNGFIII